MLSPQQMTRGLSRRRGRDSGFARSFTVVADLELPPAVFKTCLWGPRELIETGLRQWLRCCAAALRDDQLIGMPSRAVDEAWHGLILCTMRYQAFCAEAYGQFMHHNPVGGAPATVLRPQSRWPNSCVGPLSRGSSSRRRANSVSYGISTTVSEWTSPGASSWPASRRSGPP
jgi:hypothetical protein